MQMETHQKGRMRLLFNYIHRIHQVRLKQVCILNLFAGVQSDSNGIYSIQIGDSNGTLQMILERATMISG